MKRRYTLKALGAVVCGFVLPSANYAVAKTYLTVEQAKRSLWGGAGMRKMDITLSSSQKSAIKKASGVRVRNSDLQVWKTSSGGWFILDQVIGKHENIDMAFALTSSGKVKGMEILTYRESYGHEVRNANWRAQFHGRGPSTDLKLDREIKNISGATLSCAHITDAINRWTHTWSQVLRNY